MELIKIVRRVLFVVAATVCVSSIATGNALAADVLA